MKVSEVYIWSNGNIMAFDGSGQQITGLQGFILDAADGLKRNCDINTKWYWADRQAGRFDMDVRWWFEKQEENNQEENNQAFIEGEKS